MGGILKEYYSRHIIFRLVSTLIKILKTELFNFYFESIFPYYNISNDNFIINNTN